VDNPQLNNDQELEKIKKKETSETTVKNCTCSLVCLPYHLFPAPTLCNASETQDTRELDREATCVYLTSFVLSLCLTPAIIQRISDRPLTIRRYSSCYKDTSLSSLKLLVHRLEMVEEPLEDLDTQSRIEATSCSADRVPVRNIRTRHGC
jgi:hypothetical protein